MIEMRLVQSQVEVHNLPNGNKLIRFVDGNIVLIVELPEQGAKAVAAALSTGLIVASSPLPTAPPAND